jgi:hypothetical protein
MRARMSGSKQAAVWSFGLTSVEAGKGLLAEVRTSVREVENGVGWWEWVQVENGANVGRDKAWSGREKMAGLSNQIVQDLPTGHKLKGCLSTTLLAPGLAVPGSRGYSR